MWVHWDRKHCRTSVKFGFSSWSGMSCNKSTDIWKMTERDWAKPSPSLNLQGIKGNLFLGEFATFTVAFKVASLLQERVNRAGDKSKTDPELKIKSQRSSAQQQHCAITLFQLPPDISSSAQQQNYSSQYQDSHSYQRLAKHLEIGRRAVALSGNACSVQSYTEQTYRIEVYLSGWCFKSKATPFSRVSAFWSKTGTGELPQLSLCYKERNRSLHILMDSIITLWWKHPGGTMVWRE